MWRGISIALLVASLSACAAGVWVAQANLASSLVLPGATDVVVAPRGFSALRVSYRVPGDSYSWRDAVWQQVSAQGWRGRDYTFGTTRQFAVTWYSRTIGFGPLSILESAVVGGDPHDPSVVIVEVHRELHFEESP